MSGVFDDLNDEKVPARRAQTKRGRELQEEQERQRQVAERMYPSMQKDENGRRLGDIYVDTETGERVYTMTEAQQEVQRALDEAHKKLLQDDDPERAKANEERRLAEQRRNRRLAAMYPSHFALGYIDDDGQPIPLEERGDPALPKATEY